MDWIGLDALPLRGYIDLVDVLGGCCAMRGDGAGQVVELTSLRKIHLSGNLQHTLGGFASRQAETDSPKYGAGGRFSFAGANAF